jgi:integrase
MRGKANFGLTLFKRHNPSCLVHKKKIAKELRKLWMECGCPIWVEGRTPGGDIVPRQSTGEVKLKRAEAVKAMLLTQSSPVETGSVDHGPTIADCVKRYLVSREAEIGEKTLGQHRLVLDRLINYCIEQRAIYMSDLTVDLLENFKTEGLPTAESTTKATWIAKLRKFLKEAYRREWVGESLREKVTTHKAVYSQKEPYTDEEVDLILEEALRLDGGTHGYAGKPKTFRLLLDLQLETGMRVGDAIQFDPAVVVKGDHLWVYSYYPQKQKKNEVPKLVDAYLSDKLKTGIDNCDWLSKSRPFAWGDFENPHYLAGEVYYRMQAMGVRCGVKDCRPHRLRDTYAVRMLLDDVTLDELSRLLGHSSVKVTEMYYARWCRSRRTKLESRVAKTRMNR